MKGIKRNSGKEKSVAMKIKQKINAKTLSVCKLRGTTADSSTMKINIKLESIKVAY